MRWIRASGRNPKVSSELPERDLSALHSRFSGCQSTLASSAKLRFDNNTKEIICAACKPLCVANFKVETMGQPDPQLRYQLPDASLADVFLDFEAVPNQFLLTVTQADRITKCVTLVTTQFDLRKQIQCDIEIFKVA